MAFIAAPASRIALSAQQIARDRIGARANRAVAPQRRAAARMAAAPGPEGGDQAAQRAASGADVAQIPGSLEAACTQAVASIRAALDAERTRLFLEIDLTNGDETYTVLKSTLPALRSLLPRLAPGGRIRILFPDAGSAALVRRDWVLDEQATVSGVGAGLGVVVASGPGAGQEAGKEGAAEEGEGAEEEEEEEEGRKGGTDWTDETRFVFSSMEDGVPVTREDGETAGQQQQKDGVRDSMIIVVVPRASETEALQVIVEATSDDVPVLVVNPDLVDMGVTGLSLNARRLQDSLISQFVTAYYLRVFPWGVLLRAWPGRWGVWVDAPGSAVGFRLIATRDERPGTDALSDLLDEDARAAGETPGGGGIGGMLKGFKRFLDVYTKG